MKKYIGFIVMAGLIVFLGTASFAKAKAEDTGGGTNSGSGSSHSGRELEGERAEHQEDRQAFRSQMQTERKEFSDKLKSERDAFLADLKAKKDEFRKARAEVRGAFCDKAREMITKRFEFATTALGQYQTRVSSIIDSLKTDGKDTSLATESLNLSKQKLADAKAKLLSIKDVIPDDCTNVTPEEFQTVKVGAREAKDLLKESREALHQSIKEIRSLKGEDSDKEIHQ